MNIIALKDIYSDFKNSEYYSSLSNYGKRKCSKTSFLNHIKNNKYISESYYREKTINHKRYCNAIVGYIKNDIKLELKLRPLFKNT